MRRALAALLVPAALAAACRKEAPAAPAAPAPGAADPQPARIVVSSDRKDLVFSWVDAAGAYHDATAIGDIPEASRAQVLVRDLSRTPEELKSADFLYVADLRTPDGEGRFPCGAVSRRAFERQGVAQAAAQAAQAQAAAGGAVVTLYATAWCGACKQTREFLRAKKAPFLERDVEKDEGAQAELQQKLKARGLRFTGVPVLDVAGEIVTGFDPDSLAALLEKTGVTKAL